MSRFRQVNLVIFGVAWFHFMREASKRSLLIPVFVTVAMLIPLFLPDFKEKKED